MNALMWLHIAGGSALLGTVAGRLRAQGRPASRPGRGLFFASMMVLGVTASILEPFRSPPGSPIGGIIVCYFVATSWTAARRRDGVPGRFERFACAVALPGAAARLLGRVHGLDDSGGPRPGLRLRRALPARGAARSQRDPCGLTPVQRICPPLVADVLRLLHRDRIILPRPAGRSAGGGSRLSRLVRAGLRPVWSMAFWLVRVRFSKGFAPSKRTAPCSGGGEFLLEI